MNKLKGLVARLFNLAAGRRAELRTAPASAEGVNVPSLTSGFFVFDYRSMASSYGEQAFEAIQDALHVSTGTCVFHDGDVSAETLAELITQASSMVSREDSGPLTHPESYSGIGIYLVAMWTDRPEGFGATHSKLCMRGTAGYLGYLILPGHHSLSTFEQAMLKQLALPRGIAFVNGQVVSGTSKYGIH